MRICLIAEGSYPYVTGGVSSWLHTLVTRLPEYRFALVTIAAEESQLGRFKYRLPPHLDEVKEIALDAYRREEARWGKRFRLTPERKRALLALIGAGSEEVPWHFLFGMLRKRKFQRIGDFLSSRDYFDLIAELCRTTFPSASVTELFWSVRSMLLPLLTIIREQLPEADVYHSASTGYAGVVGALAKHVYGRPFLLTEHGIYSREREEEIIRADWLQGYLKDLWIEYFHRLSRCAYDYADCVVTLFGRNRDIQIELGCDPAKSFIIPNGIRADDFAPDAAGRPAEQQDGRFRIGAVVRVVPIKDIKTMIHAFAVVKRKIPEAELWIMGPTDENPEYYRECVQLVESLAVSDIVFTGEVRVRDYLGKMDVLLLTSISEGQPLAVLEGMAAGKPFVATDVGSCSELLLGRDDGIGPAGFVVPVMQAERVAEAVVALYRNPALREQMGRNGRRRVETHYRQDQFLDRYRELYETLGRRRAWRASDSN